MTNATRVSRRIDTNCDPSMENRTCRFGSTLKFPHIKLKEKKGSMPDGPFPTHNKQAGKRIFTIPTKWNVRNPPRDFTSYYCRVKDKFIVIKFTKVLPQFLGSTKTLFSFYSQTNMVVISLGKSSKVYQFEIYLSCLKFIGCNPLTLAMPYTIHLLSFITCRV